jgi:hypothetical protein
VYKYIDKVLCVWINVPTMVDYNPPFETIAKFFNIWHEHKRGGHHGLHEFYFESNYLLLLNIHEDIEVGTYRKLIPKTTKPFRKDDFHQPIKNMKKLKQLQPKIKKAKQAGLSCHEICQEYHQECQEEELSYINNCETLETFFTCSQCIGSIGPDQPAYVKDDASPRSLPRSCLYNYDIQSSPLTCEGYHPDTMRLCVCQ